MATQTDTQTQVIRIPAALRNLAELAMLLERVETRGTPTDPDQYRRLVAAIQEEIGRLPGDAQMHSLLSCFPATAALYENLSYGSAGLCLQPLEHSVESEQRTRALLAEIAKARPAQG